MSPMDGKRSYLWRGKVNDSTGKKSEKLFCVCEFYAKNAEAMSSVVVIVSTGSEDWKGEGNTGSMTTSLQWKGNLVLELKNVLDGRTSNGNICVKEEMGKKGLEVVVNDKRIGWMDLEETGQVTFLEVVMRDWLAEKEALKEEEEKLERVNQDFDKVKKRAQQLANERQAEDARIIDNLSILLHEKELKKLELGGHKV